MLVMARISLWGMLCGGLADLVNGDASCDFLDSKYLFAYVGSWLAATVTQMASLIVSTVPPCAKLIVAGTTSIAHTASHTFLSSQREWPHRPTAAIVRVQSVIRWGFQALIVLLTVLPDGSLSSPHVLGYVLGAQALWQFYTWINSLQSGLMHTFGLYVNSLLLSHAVSIRATWTAQQMGWVHIAIFLYTLFAFSSIMYEPRVSLPYQLEDVNMRIWCGPSH
jgi:hypothetical protein